MSISHRDANWQQLKQRWRRRWRDTTFAAVLICYTLSGCGSRTVSTTENPSSSPTTPSAPAVAIDDLTPEQVVLADEKQQFIWDAEHATHLIERRFGVRFLEAMQVLDTTEMARFFTEDAAAYPLQQDRLDKTEIGSVQSSEIVAKTSPRVSRDELCKWLLTLHDDLGDLTKYSLRVLAIDKTPDGKWIANLLLSGRGTTRDGGPKLVQSKHRVSFQWQDIEDLEDESSIQEWRVETVKASQADGTLLSEVTRPAMLDRLPIQDNWKLRGGAPQMLRFQMAVEDYDRDGYFDIAISSVGTNLLLRYVQGRFVPVTQRLGIHAESRGPHVDISTSWIDYDNDGYPDLILGGRLYHNEEGKRFVDVTSQSGLVFAPHHMGCAVADYDLDGNTDLYFTYAHDADSNSAPNKAWIGDDQSGGSNRLWRNLGDGTFKDVTEHAGVAGGKRQSFAANWLFADGDRYPDLYVANDFGENSLFRNRGDGTFEDISAPSNTADFATSMGVASGDLDNDGDVEIYVANMYSKMGRRIVGQVSETDYPPGVFSRLQGACAGSRLYRRNDTQTDLAYSEFSETAGVNQVGWAYAPAMVDLNNDGLLDLYATCGFLSVDRKKPDG